MLAIKQHGVQVAWSGRKTLFYTTFFKAHYEQVGRPAPTKPHDYVIDVPGSVEALFDRTRLTLG